ncbi:hypothetical protein [Nonomuraea angiospora]|uniref:hypothetical protein n=1 Tax=Nonomuraea angiospora TaxID=46172 RepID=UPI0029B70D45|nr:hypothetical protein [Nonomuraea angiospora]MDX3107304.1 hypothetical protein [Nonomuraea angiospora]
MNHVPMGPTCDNGQVRGFAEHVEQLVDAPRRGRALGRTFSRRTPPPGGGPISSGRSRERRERRNYFPGSA